MTEPHLGGTYAQQLEAARWAEAESLASFARCDHYLSGGDPSPDATDAFAVLAGLARETSDIRLCVLVTPITFRHPAVIVKNATTIDQMSGGRLDLGVGTGWMELEHVALGLPFPDWPERWARFEETLDYIEAAFGDGPGKLDGEYYSVDADVRPKPEGIRLVIGGSGPKRTPRLAATRADEYNFFITTPDTARKRISVMRDATGERDVEATVMGPAIVGADDVSYRERLSTAAAKRDTTPEDFEKELAERGIPHGTTSHVAEQLTALEEAGVDRFYVQWLDLDDLDAMKETVSVVRGN
ncbi:MAG: LLM class flavin-dependent oxidoreductase [Acidimicrobiia bacterium]|jgi:alkanesulfonate monooxygenase SsuD/methylene tetrahydromethanopterin reductase-like flavin-dependent oxidoreductase (luciferase family)